MAAHYNELETNELEPSRSQLRAFLEARGYTYAGSEEFDDYYQSECAFDG